MAHYCKIRLHWILSHLFLKGPNTTRHTQFTVADSYRRYFCFFHCEYWGNSFRVNEGLRCGINKESYRQLLQRHIAQTDKKSAAPRSSKTSKTVPDTDWLPGPDQLVCWFLTSPPVMPLLLPPWAEWQSLLVTFLPLFNWWLSFLLFVLLLLLPLFLRF